MTKEELLGVRNLRERIDKLESHLEILRRRVDSITPILDGMPHALTLESRIERLMIQIVDESRELESCREILLPKVANLTNKICRAVTDLNVRNVLLMRYVDRFKFSEIATELNLSADRVYQLHRAGLEKLQLHYSIDL